VAIFAFLYLILIVYAVFLRLDARGTTKRNEPVGVLYKIQAYTAIGISAAAATTINILFAEVLLDWFVQYIPTIIVGLIVVIWPGKKKPEKTNTNKRNCKKTGTSRSQKNRDIQIAIGTEKLDVHVD